MVGRRLDVAVLDLDDEIERAAGRTIAEIFDHVGEDGFRDLETDVLTTALSRMPVSIVSCGGGVVTRAQNRLLLTSRSCCVWMTAHHAALSARVAASRTKRPLLEGELSDRLRALAREREPWFVETAEITVDASVGTAWDVTELVIAALVAAVPPAVASIAPASDSSGDPLADSRGREGESSQ